MTVLISIIIVNYNSGDYLLPCLRSIEEQTIRRELEVIVVDNASADGSMGHLEAFPWVRVEFNEANIGFAGGQNCGIALAAGRHIMPLNFDIVLEPDFVERMAAALEGEPAAGSACGKLMQLKPDGTRTDRFYSTGHLLPANRFPLHRGAGEADRGQYDQREWVFGAPGAAVLYRREMMEDITWKGQFYDETFFAWYEDVDVDWRAAWRGWRCLYEPSAVAHHVGGVSTSATSELYVTTTIRNRWMMIAANECPHCRRENHRALRTYEIGLLRYVTRIGRLAAYQRALAQYRVQLPQIRRKREYNNSRARVACPLGTIAPVES